MAVEVDAALQITDSGTTRTLDLEDLAQLPSGAATSAAQTTANTALQSILAKLADPATQTTLAAVLAKLSADPATQTTLAAILAKIPGADVPQLVDLDRADPAIQAGTGDATVTVTGRLLQVVMVGGASDGSLQINDEDEITVPANTPLTFEPRGVWDDATVTITGSSSYLVESAP